MDTSNIEPFQIDINSANRKSGSYTDFFIELQIPQGVKYTRVVLDSCVICKVFYNVQEGYNYFTLIENGVSVIVSIPALDYSTTTFAKALSDNLTSYSPNKFIYNVTFPKGITTGQSGKLTFSVSNNTIAGVVIQPVLYFSTPETLFEQMGFQLNKYYNFSSNTLTSDKVIFLQSERSVFLHSDILTNPYSNVLQAIYTTPATNFGIIVYQQTGHKYNSRKYNGNNKGLFHFTLTDENDIPIDTLDFQFTIILW